MNFRIIYLILLVSAQIYAQQDEIISIQYSTVKSEYSLSDKSMHRLYTPARASVVQFLGTNHSTFGDYGNYISRNQRSSIPVIKIQQSSIDLSGPHIVLLEPYLIPAMVNKIGSNVLFNQVDNTPAYIKIDPFDDYRRIEQMARTSEGIEYAGLYLYHNANVLPYRYSLSGINMQNFFRKNSSSYVYGSSLLNLWKDFLESENFHIYGSPFFIRVANGDVYPAVIKIYGTEKPMYAMYGVWTDENKAGQYGYHKGDRIYFSSKSVLPKDNDSTCNAALELGMPKNERYGYKVFTYDEIMSDRRNILPQLSWSAEPIHSDMDGKEYDQTGTPFYKGIEVPNSPDNENNMNGMGLQQCPDMDWYWSLFCDCAGKIVNVPENVHQPSEFVDFRDYVHMEMVQKQYDPTLYGEDNTVAPFKVTPETQPIEPFLFNKDGVLLNKNIPEMHDPFASDAKFSLYKKYWDWSIDNMGWHSKSIDVTSNMKRCINELRYVYNYFCLPGKHSTEWSYKKTGNLWKKKWLYDGDVELSLQKPEYADSAWYIANPFANYASYEDFNSFAVYDNNTAASKGPFRTIAREYDTRVNDKTDQPEYQRYENPWIGGDIPAEHYWEKKDWYIQWQYYIIHKDKWGRKSSIGTLTFTSTLWRGEDEGLMTPDYSFNDNRYNAAVKVGGNSLFGSQVAYYDKNSKDYRTDQKDIHERDPDEFDKGDALREIARKILIAEAFDYTMKTLHYIGTHQNNYVGITAAVLYETSKRVENRISQSVAYKLAKNTYEGYMLWRRTMDILKDIRDTYLRIGDAWNGLLYTTKAISDYYSNLDLRNIRLTNITDLFPRKAFIELDYRLYSIQKSFSNFNAAIHAFALQSDSLTGGNYGPLNPVIRVTYAALQSSILQSGQNTAQLLDNTNAEIQNLKSKTKGTSSDQQYLSNITRSTYNIINNQRIKVMNNGTRNMALALYMMESESKQWLSYSRYMKRITNKAPGKFDQAITEANSDSWAALAGSLYQPDLFDSPTSKYFLKLSEDK